VYALECDERVFSCNHEGHVRMWKIKDFTWKHKVWKCEGAHKCILQTYFGLGSSQIIHIMDICFDCKSSQICIMGLSFDLGSSQMHNWGLFWSWKFTWCGFVLDFLVHEFAYFGGLFWSCELTNAWWCLFWFWKFTNAHNGGLLWFWKFTNACNGSLFWSWELINA